MLTVRGSQVVAVGQQHNCTRVRIPLEEYPATWEAQRHVPLWAASKEVALRSSTSNALTGGRRGLSLSGSLVS